jgi:hypothetical protein
MYVLHVLNSAGEEEFITRKFKTKFRRSKVFPSPLVNVQRLHCNKNIIRSRTCTLL